MKRIRSVALMALLALGAGMAGAQSPGVSDGVVRIGLITDMSGFLSDLTGEGAAVAVRMAVADFGGKVLGKPIEFVVADNQNKADIAASKTREWLDAQKVDMVIDLGNSATALATIEVAKQKNRVAIATSPGTTRITNENCGATVVHYAYDTFALANGIGKALVKKGLDSWYFVTIDFAGGHSIEKDTSDVVKAQGGRVLGAVRHPINPGDFSSFILQAQGSKAKVVGFASAGGDAINAIKTANQFGLPAGGQTLAGSVHLHQRHPRPGPGPCAGHVRDHRLLLGPERRNPQVVAPLLRADPAYADDGAGGQLFGDDALPEGDRRHGNR
jgi:branched-chain amino acid transport system substrate-binding protein